MIITENIESIKNELAQCRNAADKGYKLAADKYAEIRETLREEEEKIAETNRKQNELSQVKNSSLIEDQMKGMEFLKKRVESIGDDVIALHAQQKDFSIVLYGRTMAGKSTLMEVLTHGDGKSIGKGAQRTTTDVRSYYWNGLKIIDVPGVCSFESEEDDKVAFEAAKTADLVLFLLTDDAPQEGEARALAQIRRIGKPVLGIVNVKMAFDINKKKLALRKLQKELADTERLNIICQQFKDFDTKFNQEWDNIPFVYTHLKAAFDSQAERGNDSEVYQASNFAQVENFILEKLFKDGKFLRVKNFIDGVAVPMEKIIAAIYAHSGNTLKESRIWANKLEQFQKWSAEFMESTKKRVLRHNEACKAIIDAEIDEFASSHYEDKNAGDNWKKRIEELNFSKKYMNLLQELADECNRKRRNLSGELMAEMNYTFSGKMNLSEINLEEISDIKTGVQIGAAVLSVPLMFLGPVGIGAGLLLNAGVSKFMDSKQDKIRKAKAKLVEELTAPSHKMIDDLQKKFVGVINEQIVNGELYKFSNDLKIMSRVIAQLGYIQTNLAMVLGRKFNDLNIELLTNALEYSQLPANTEEPETIEEPVEEETSRFSGFFSSAKKMISRAEKNKNDLFNSVSKKINNVKWDNVGEALSYSWHAGALSGVKYLMTGISFIARVPGEEFLIVSDNFEGDAEKISEILGNKFVYLPILKAEKFEAVEKILGCKIHSVKCPLDDNKNAFVIVPLEPANDTNLALAQQIAELPIVKE